MSLSPTSCKLFLGRPTRRFALKIPDPRLRGLELFATPRKSSHAIAPRGATACGACKAFFQLDIDPARRRFGTAQAKSTGSFHSDGLIGRDARTTSAQGRACSAAPVDSGGATRRL